MPACAQLAFGLPVTLVMTVQSPVGAVSSRIFLAVVFVPLISPVWQVMRIKPGAAVRLQLAASGRTQLHLGSNVLTLNSSSYALPLTGVLVGVLVGGIGVLVRVGVFVGVFVAAPISIIVTLSIQASSTSLAKLKC